jgi:hypothetical protein
LFLLSGPFFFLKYLYQFFNFIFRRFLYLLQQNPFNQSACSLYESDHHFPSYPKANLLSLSLKISYFLTTSSMTSSSKMNSSNFNFNFQIRKAFYQHPLSFIMFIIFRSIPEWITLVCFFLSAYGELLNCLSFPKSLHCTCIFLIVIMSYLIRLKLVQFKWTFSSSVRLWA